MKQFITLSYIFICTGMVVAQSNSITSNRVKMHQTFLKELIRQSGKKSGTKTIDSWSSQRVIAQCTRDTSGAKTDSVKLSYRFNDTSTYDFNMMEYAYNYPYNTSPLFKYMGIYTQPQVFFGIYHHWTINPNTLIYGFYEKDFTTYDAHGNMTNDTAFYADSASYRNMIYINKFNSANNIDSSYSFIYHAGIADSAFQQFFSYDASNNLIKDSIYEFALGAWHLVSKTFYTYDTFDNLVQIDNYSNNSDATFTLPLIEQLQYINTYDVSNRMLTVLTSYYDGTTLTPYVKDTFAYTAAHPFHTSWKEYQYDAINTYWAPMINMNKHLNAGGFPDEITIESFDSLSNSWVPSAKQLITYNSFNHPDTLFDYEYNFTSFPSEPSFTTIYYYETFMNTTSVNDIAAKNNITVFPNPASDKITLSGLTNTASSVTLYDVEGRIQNKQLIPLGIKQFELNIHSLSPGIYFVIIQDNADNIVSKQSIIKVKS